MKLEYTYTEEPDGWLVGRLDVYPNCPTQGGERNGKRRRNFNMARRFSS